MSSQNKQPSNQNLMDPMMLGVILLLVIVIVSILWSKFHTQIATAYSWIRMAQFSAFWAIGEGLSFLSNPFQDWFNFFWKSDKSLIQVGHLMNSSFLANIFTLVFVVLPAAWWVAKRSLATNPYNHKHFGKPKDYTLHTYTDRMGAYYPHLKLFRKLNLTRRPLDDGKYRMADTEKQFAIKNRLLDRIKGNEFKVNRDRAMEVFRQQLGKLWTGYASLSRSEYAVIAALAPRIAATDPAMSEDEYKAALKMTDELIGAYWRSSADSYDPDADTMELDLELAKKAVRQYGKHPRVQKIIKGHAYVATVIYAMLTEARSLGVLAACDMRWLRVTDRRLWLVFDNVGRIVAFAEVSGVYSHFLHEHRQKRAIERPQVDSAVKALNEAVDSYKFTEPEIEEVNAQLKAVEDKPVIDMKSLEKTRKTLVLAVATVGSGSKSDILEAALLTEAGEVVYAERCKPLAEIDEESRRAFGLVDDDLVALVKKAPESAKVKEKLLELSNGQRVVAYNDAAVAAISGLDRSAAEVVLCSPIFGEGAPKTVYDAAATLQLGVAVPASRSALAEAKACREVWVELQKRALKAKQAKKGGQA